MKKSSFLLKALLSFQIFVMGMLALNFLGGGKLAPIYVKAETVTLPKKPDKPNIPWATKADLNKGYKTWLKSYCKDPKSNTTKQAEKEYQAAVWYFNTAHTIESGTPEDNATAKSLADVARDAKAIKNKSNSIKKASQGGTKVNKLSSSDSRGETKSSLFPLMNNAFGINKKISNSYHLLEIFPSFKYLMID